MLSLNDIAYNHVKEKILSGAIRAGERIREDLLADDLSISRTPVREAINKLVMEDLVKSIPRRGIYCVRLTPDDICDLCDIRLMYEVYAVKRCIELCLPEEIFELEQLSVNFEKALLSNQSSATADNLFHEKLIDYARNGRLSSTYSLITNHLLIMHNMLDTDFICRKFL